MTTLTLDELRAAFESILVDPPVHGHVRDQHTGSLGLVQEDLGTAPDERGKPVQRLFVKVTEPKAHHKKGDSVIWRDPVPCGQ